jgi:hypothetical protein
VIGEQNAAPAGLEAGGPAGKDAGAPLTTLRIL